MIPDRLLAAIERFAAAWEETNAIKRLEVEARDRDNAERNATINTAVKQALTYLQSVQRTPE